MTTDPALRALQGALDAYRAMPLNTDDSPASWRALDELLDACDAALAAAEAAPLDVTDEVREITEYRMTRLDAWGTADGKSVIVPIEFVRAALAATSREASDGL